MPLQWRNQLGQSLEKGAGKGGLEFGTLPVYTLEFGALPVYTLEFGTLPVYTLEFGALPVYTV